MKDKDITKKFNAVGHSDRAKKILSFYNIKRKTDDFDWKYNKNEKIKREYIVRKLFTNEDKRNVHKTLGFLCLLSFFYRYFYVFPKTGRLGIKNDFFGYFTLFLHLTLSCSSLIFHVLEKRNTRNPLIMYEEYRLHAIFFTSKAVFTSILGLHMHKIPSYYIPLAFVVCSYFFNIIVDIVTKYKGTKGVTAVRNRNKIS